MAESDRTDEAIQPGMSEGELRAAGVPIDLPYEAGSASPQPLRYGPDDDGELERRILDRMRAADGDGEAPEPDEAEPDEGAGDGSAAA